MTLALIIGLILVMGFIIIDRCNKILAEMKWLRTYNDISKIEKKLSLLSLMPLSDTANEIKQLDDMATEEFNRTLKRWEAIEWRELEKFFKTTSSDSEIFIPSTHLKDALVDWSTRRVWVNIVEEWKAVFQKTFLELFSGKILIEQAREKLSMINRASLMEITSSNPEVQKIYNNWASEWAAGKWKERLEFLRSIRQHIIIRDKEENA